VHHHQPQGITYTMAEIYVPTEAYRAAVNAIAAKTGVDPDEIKITLGEAGNIWPASILEKEMP
jgi:3-oxoacyl-[acyl-carrier-protein] synthase III